MRGDMTQGSEAKQILMFTLPIMAGQFLQQLYNTVDGIIVGRYAQEAHALAAVGTCGPAIFFLIALIIGISSGGSILISQYFGAKRLDEMRRAISTLLIFLTVAGVAASVLTAVFSRWILRVVLSVTDEAILPLASAYLSIYCAGIVFSFVYNGLAGILRGVGNSRSTLLFLMVCTVVNLLLDLLFVVVFHWGVIGAAAATVISQAISAFVSTYYLFRRAKEFAPTRETFVFRKDACATMLKLSIPTTLQQVVVSSGGLALQRLVNTFGPVSMNAYAASYRIELFTMVPIISFSTGFVSFVAQNVGAGRFDRVRRGYRSVLIMVLICTALLSGTTYLFAPQLVGFFGVGGEELARGVEHIRFLAPFLLLFSMYMQTGAILRGAGDVIVASLVTLSSFIVRVFGAYCFTALGMIGYSGAWHYQPYGWAVSLLIAELYYFGGRWKRKALVRPGEEAAETAGEKTDRAAVLKGGEDHHAQ